MAPIAAMRSPPCRRPRRAGFISSNFSILLEGFPLASQGANSAATIHLLAEAMKLAYADRAEYLGDPDQVKIPVGGLISKAYAERLRAADFGGARAARGRDQTARSGAL